MALKSAQYILRRKSAKHQEKKWDLINTSEIKVHLLCLTFSYCKDFQNIFELTRLTFRVASCLEWLLLFAEITRKWKGRSFTTQRQLSFRREALNGPSAKRAGKWLGDSCSDYMNLPVAFAPHSCLSPWGNLADSWQQTRLPCCFLSPICLIFHLFSTSVTTFTWVFMCTFYISFKDCPPSFFWSCCTLVPSLFSCEICGSIPCSWT